MSVARKMLDSTKLFIAMAVWLAVWLAANLWPASFWYEANSVQIIDAQADAPISMLVDRTIHRPFVGEWVATVRRVGPSGVELYCSGSGRANYRPKNDLPAVVTLGWWTGGACNTLPGGDYVVDTTWQINPGTAFLPDKHVRNTSNVFHVCANPDCRRLQPEVTP